MGRWKASQIMSGIAKFYNKSTNPTHISTVSVLQFKPPHYYITSPPPPIPRFHLFNLRPFSALPCPSTTIYGNEYDDHHLDQDYSVDSKDDQESGSIHILDMEDGTVVHIWQEQKSGVTYSRIPGYPSIDLKSMQAENSSYVVPPSTRSSNYIALRFGNLSSDSKETEIKENVRDCRYMVVYQYGSAVLFNIEEHEVDSYLELVRRHASGILQESRKDDYAVKENTLLAEDMQGGADYIVLKNLDIDSIRVIGSVLGQSIALDYFVSQVDGMLEEFTGINRGMEKTGTFTMERKKLFQLVGKANSTMADVILRVGLFERSDIAWRDAKYAQIFEYLREEYEVTQRFGNLDFKLKFVEHNVHFLQEVLQNRKSDLLEWCIILLLSIENIIGLYEIVRESTAISF